jgi:hypothetical protein
VNAAALNRADNPFARADLGDGDVFAAVQAEVAQGDARAGMQRGAVAADADALAAQLLRLLDLGTNH